MMLAAWADGVGSNWVGFGGLDKARALLDIPGGLDVLAILPFGYPARAPWGKAGSSARRSGRWRTSSATDVRSSSGLCATRTPWRRPASRPVGSGRSIQLSPPSSLANTSPPLVAQNMRRGCRASKASANMVVFGSTPMFTRLQLAPPSLLRNSAPTSLWKFEPAATQMVFGSPGTSRMSRQ